MGRPWIIAVLISVIICLSIPQGDGSRVKIKRLHLERSLFALPLNQEEKKGREMVQMVEMDYQLDPGANTNPRTGAFFNIPNPTPPPSHRH